MTPNVTSAPRTPAETFLATPGRQFGRGGAALRARGEPMVWLLGGGLVVALGMTLGLLALVFAQGISTLWPVPLTQVTLWDGTVHLGEVTRDDYYHPTDDVLHRLPADLAERARTELAEREGLAHRRLFRTGNYELTNEHFNWVSDFEIREETRPRWAVVLERQTWGRFYGEPVAFHRYHPIEGLSEEGDAAERRRRHWERAREIAEALRTSGVSTLLYAAGDRLIEPDAATDRTLVTAVVEVREGAEAAWQAFEQYHSEVRRRWKQRRRLEKYEIGAINRRREMARLQVRKRELDLQRRALQRGEDSETARKARERLEAERALYARVEQETQKAFSAVREEIQRLNRINAEYRIVIRTSTGTEKAIELADIVRAYPANQLSWARKWGIYLSRWAEFLGDDPREANMEGGVFPAIFGTVTMTLVLSLLVAPFGVLAALYLREYAKSGPLISAVRIAINNLAGVPSIVFGVFGLGFFCYLVGGAMDRTFFVAKLPVPTYGTGGILWSSLTLALLTLPVVIVATEEALAAVPSSMREGSYACGASKWQTIRRIVLPRAMPGILTGMILAMARGAGEVAPLMLVGAVKLAPELPIDRFFPFIHPERSFMHLGFHIYDLGFQSQNSEAAKPMVFTTTLLLIAIIAILNLTAIILRSRLRRKFHTGVF